MESSPDNPSTVAESIEINDGSVPCSTRSRPNGQKSVPMPGVSAIIQAPVQALLRPSMWLPGIKQLHSYKERWKMEGVDKNEITKCICEALKILTKSDPTDAYYDIHKISKDFIRIFVYTWAEWVDVIEINLNTGDLMSFSSGLVPLSVPFAVLFNLIFFWVPFYDNKFNRDRVKLLRDTMEIKVEATVVSDGC